MHAESTKGKVTFSLVSPAFRTDHTYAHRLMRTGLCNPV